MKTPTGKVLVTGGAGFIGSNVVVHHLQKGDDVIILDNLSRRGVTSNLEWLRKQGRFSFTKGDVRDAATVRAVFKKNPTITTVYHMAAQVAVTTSVSDPRLDFEVNALGTFNMLEATRQHAPKAAFIYTSTNKVFGDLADLGIRETKTRYEFRDKKIREKGVPESQPLDFHSPYGCSKGSADQYVHDYSRIYGLRTIVFRQSCIYGTRQIGAEDQGWAAWFLIRAILGEKVTIYGDGKQVRDLLWVGDLVRAYELAAKRISRTAGSVYNIGGGPRNSLSLLEFMEVIEEITGKPLKHGFAEERPGDQRIFIADNSSALADFGWRPAISYRDGIRKQYEWLHANKHVFGG
jgi:CDP-paratose 2-epimerase